MCRCGKWFWTVKRKQLMTEQHIVTGQVTKGEPQTAGTGISLGNSVIRRIQWCVMCAWRVCSVTAYNVAVGWILSQKEKLHFHGLYRLGKLIVNDEMKWHFQAFFHTCSTCCNTYSMFLYFWLNMICDPKEHAVNDTKQPVGEYNSLNNFKVLTSQFKNMQLGKWSHLEFGSLPFGRVFDLTYF